MGIRPVISNLDLVEIHVMRKRRAKGLGGGRDIHVDSIDKLTRLNCSLVIWLK